jgi:hypothetical protein
MPLTTKRKLRKLLVRTQCAAGVHDWAFSLFHDLMPTTPESIKLLDDLLERAGSELGTITIYDNKIYQFEYATHNLQTGHEWKSRVR